MSCGRSPAHALQGTAEAIPTSSTSGSDVLRHNRFVFGSSSIALREEFRSD